MKFFFSVVVILVLLYHFTNKIFAPSYCSKLSGSEINFTKNLNDKMRKCQDTFLCKLGDRNDYIFKGIKMKKWNCIPKIGDLDTLGKKD